MKLNTELNIADPDAFYERLIETHAGLTDAQSLALNAKAVALLSDLIGDEKVLQEAAGIAAEEAAQAEAKIREAEENERIARLLADEAERKAKRDARYAARKQRTGRTPPGFSAR